MELLRPLVAAINLIARVIVPTDVSDEAMKETALASERVQAKLEDKQVVKTIVKFSVTIRVPL